MNTNLQCYFLTLIIYSYGKTPLHSQRNPIGSTHTSEPRQLVESLQLAVANDGGYCEAWRQLYRFWNAVAILRRFFQTLKWLIASSAMGAVIIVSILAVMKTLPCSYILQCEDGMPNRLMNWFEKWGRTPLARHESSTSPTQHHQRLS